jgi:hypothetical protein
VRAMAGVDRCDGQRAAWRGKSLMAQVGWLDFSAREAIILHKIERWLEICASRGLLCE